MNTIFKDDAEVKDLLEHKNNGAALINRKFLGSGNHHNHDTSNKRAGEQLRDTESKVDVAVLAEVVGNRNASLLTNVHESAISKYSRGLNASNDEDPELKKELDRRLDLIERKAVDVVDLFLKSINQEKVLELDAGKMAASAEKAINVVDKIRRRNDKEGANVHLPTINLYGPTLMKVENFEQKEV